MEGLKRMEELFLFHAEVHAFTLSVYVEDTWQLQIKNMYRNWNKLHRLMNTKELMEKFKRDCIKKNLPWEDFDAIGMFVKVQGALRREMALRVANRIAQLFSDRVFWDDIRIVSFNFETDDIEIDDCESDLEVDKDLYDALQ